MLSLPQDRDWETRVLEVEEADLIDVFLTKATNASFNQSVYNIEVTRASNSAYNFGEYYSGGSADLEFKFSGDGNGTCDGSWTGGGADYAEYVESVDGESIPSGTSVVFENGKIRAAFDRDWET